MTELNLICNPPYTIGLIASLNFIGFTIGSLLFVHYADQYGRKWIVIIATSVTPIGIACIMFFGNSLDRIYYIVLTIGLTYSTRSSVSYLYATELLPEK